MTTHNLNLTRQIATKELQALANINAHMPCFHGQTITTKLLNKPPIKKSGEITGMPPNPINIDIYAGNIKRTSFPWSKIDDTTFINNIIAIQHEFRHAEQMCKICQEDTEFGKHLALSQLAVIGNEDFKDNQYTNLLHEIDAAKESISAAQSYLKTTFPEQDTDTLLVNAVNQEIELGHNPYFQPGTKFKTPEDIIAEFQQKINDYDKHPKFYPNNMQTYTDDEFSCALNRLSIGYTFNAFTIKFKKSHSNYEVDKLMAAMTEHIHPGIKNVFASLDNTDISIQTTYGQKFPDTTEETIEYIELLRQDNAKTRKMHGFTSQSKRNTSDLDAEIANLSQPETGQQIEYE